MNLAALVQPQRLLSDLEVLARISEPGEGVTRLGYSSQEREAHAWLTSRMQKAGLLPDPDGAGNLFGWLTPPDGRPVLLTGSHLDSVPHGGRFDGALGVLAALEVLRAWKEAGRLPGAPVGMVAFACEESTRFSVGCLGSRWMVGALTPERAQDIRDSKGCTLWESMAAAGCNRERLAEVRRPAGWLRAFLEAHIDQGAT